MPSEKTLVRAANPFITVGITHPFLLVNTYILLTNYLYISLIISIFVVDERDISQICITPEPLAGQNFEQ